MEITDTSTKNLPEGKIMLSLSLLVLAFFLFATAVNVFRWETILTGVFWELLMLPSLAGIVVLPLYIAICFRKASATSQRLFRMALLVWALSLIPLTMVVLEVGR